MQEFVFFIDGDVNHPLTIDPTVWIFDERKVDLTTYFDEEGTLEDDDTAYTKAISKQWDKEITEGSSPPNPNSNQNEIKYEKQKLINGSFGMPLKPFLDNSEPIGEPISVEVVEKDGTIHTFPFAKVHSSVVGFSHKGQKLSEDGPIHLYIGKGANRKEPIKNIIKFTVRNK